MERMHAAHPLVPESNRQRIHPGSDRSRMLRFSAALSMPVQVQGSVRLTECHDPHGFRVTLDGAVVLAGLAAVLSFGRDAHQSHFNADRFKQNTMTLIPPGEWFTVAAAASRAPIDPGAPIRIRFHDGDGTRISETCEVGPCDREPHGFALSFHVPVAVTVEIATDTLSLVPSSRSTIGGNLVFLRGILAHCMYPWREPDRYDDEPLVAATEAVAIPIGQTVRIPDQPMSRTTPAHPLRAISFLDGLGHPLGRFVPRAGARNGKPWRGGGSI